MWPANPPQKKVGVQDALGVYAARRLASRIVGEQQKLRRLERAQLAVSIRMDAKRAKDEWAVRMDVDSTCAAADPTAAAAAADPLCATRKALESAITAATETQSALENEFMRLDRAVQHAALGQFDVVVPD